MAVPDCACDQLFENRLWLMATRRAFFNSNRFFTCHNVAAPGVPVVEATRPSSVNDVPLMTQYRSCAPAVRPYTRYSVASGTAFHCTITFELRTTATFTSAEGAEMTALVPIIRRATTR